ncbi:MAB_1171c family putative transporter [Micromonospora sp. NPDC048839]|uniref:MAB_1171c family putative transporter n=1 Tax=Micromonospora sp. NPDC048839 TaxID=3155641 RepID=UPI0033FC3885
MSEPSAAELVVVAALWIVSVARAHALHSGPAHRAVWAAITGLAVSMTVRVEPIAHAIDQLAGVHGAGVLVKHLAGLVAVAALFDLAVLGTATHVRRRVSLAGLAVTVVIMTCLFWTMPRVDSEDFADQAAGKPIATAYILSWTVYLGVAITLSARLFRRAHRASRHRVVRAGQLVLVVGCSIGTGYALYRAAYFGARLAVGPPSRGDIFYVDLSDDIKYLAMLLITAGLTIAGAPGTRANLRARRHLRTLDPLWHDLVPADHRLDPPGLSPRERLSRHVVELHDTIHDLYRRTDEQLVHRVHDRLATQGLTSQDLAAATEASLLRIAQALPPAVTPAAPYAPPPTSPDPAERLARLLDLAHVWDTTAVRDALTHASTAPEPHR